MTQPQNWKEPKDGFEKPPVSQQESGQKPAKSGRFWPVVLGVVGVLAVLSLGMFGMSTFNEMVEPLDHVVLDAFEPKTEEEKIVSSAQKKDDQNAPSAKADRSTVVELVPASEEVLSAGKVYQQVSPSVVGIQTYEQDAYGMEQLFSSGSGIILSEDGYLLTNAHVITNLEGKASSRIEVTFPRTGEVLEAEFLGADVESDLALIRVEAEGLQPAEFADSASCEVGDTAYVIGNPSGEMLASSMSSGIISGIDRKVDTENGTMTLMQTDAAVNPGNSGGALLNSAGQVVGVVSSKIVETSFEGIGFAIPSQNAQTILNDIAEHGYVTGRVRIGLSYQAISDVIIEKTGIPSGIRVVSVEESSDAYGKVVPGDIILSIDGIETTDSEGVTQALEGKEAGDMVELEIFHVDENGLEETKTVEVQMTEDRSQIVEAAEE